MNNVHVHQQKAPERVTVANTSNPLIWVRLQRFLWRSSLAGFIGLLFGSIGGIWYCMEQYANLSSEAQGWVIFVLPFYLLTVIVFAGVGLLAGALLGVVRAVVSSLR